MGKVTIATLLVKLQECTSKGFSGHLNSTRVLIARLLFLLQFYGFGYSSFKWTSMFNTSVSTEKHRMRLMYTIMQFSCHLITMGY